MTAIQAVALYAAINLLLLALISVPIGLNRNKKKISLGDGNDVAMAALIRGHGNAAEWIPGALLGLFLLASVGTGALIIHVLGIAFTLARFAHAYAFLTRKTTHKARLFGAAVTLLVYLAIAVLLLLKAFA